MSGPVVIEERRGDIALISIDHPPVNALAHSVRSALLEAVIAADGDAEVRAIVIRGVGRFAETHGREYWTPAPLLEEIAAAGDTFQAWQSRRAATMRAS